MLKSNLLVLLATIICFVKSRDGDICGWRANGHYYDCAQNTTAWTGPTEPGFYGAVDLEIVNSAI